MPRFKRVIMRLSVFLLLFLLVATVLSKTVYRLLLPHVNEAYVSVTGGLENTFMLRAVVGSLFDETGGESAQNGESSAEAAPAEPKYAVELSLSFREIQLLFAQGSSLTATAEMVREPVGMPVDIWTDGYDYDSASDRYIVHYFVRSREKPIETGAPLAITIKPFNPSFPYFVPLNSVYTVLLAGKPQYYVYVIEDSQTIWGRETFVQKKMVTLGGSDYQSAQVDFTGEAPKRVACYPSRPLNDGDTVKVLIES